MIEDCGLYYGSADSHINFETNNVSQSKPYYLLFIYTSANQKRVTLSQISSRPNSLHNYFDMNLRSTLTSKTFDQHVTIGSVDTDELNVMTSGCEIENYIVDSTGKIQVKNESKNLY